MLLDAECQADGTAVGTGATGFGKGKKSCQSSSPGHIRPGKKERRKNRFVQMKRFAERNETNASFKTQRPELKAAY